MKGALLAALALVLGILLVLVTFMVTRPEATMDPAAEYRYVVTSEGGTYYARNGSGTILTSGDNAATVINTALGALTPGRTAKETVLLDGNFALSSSIELPSNTTLKLAQGSKVIGASQVSTVLLDASQAINIEITGGEWDGNKAERDLAGNTIMAIAGCTNVTLRSLEAYDAPYDGIALNSCTQVLVSGVEVGRVGHTALVMGNCSDCTVEGSHFFDCAGGGCYFLCEEGVSVCGSHNNVVRNNTVERTYLTGLSLASLREAQHQGSATLAEHNTVIDCGLDGSHPGIVCGWGDNKATNCVIRYNIIYETKAFWPPNGNGTNGGIDARCDDSQIYGNTVLDTYDYGIEVAGERNRVWNNRISGTYTAGYGGLVCENSTDCEVVNNTITDCPVGIRVLDSSSNHISGNRFENMADYIVLIADATSTSNVVENNTYVGTGDIYDAGTATVIRNNTSAS